MSKIKNLTESQRKVNLFSELQGLDVLPEGMDYKTFDDKFYNDSDGQNVLKNNLHELGLLPDDYTKEQFEDYVGSPDFFDTAFKNIGRDLAEISLGVPIGTDVGDSEQFQKSSLEYVEENPFAHSMSSGLIGGLASLVENVSFSLLPGEEILSEFKKSQSKILGQEGVKKKDKALGKEDWFSYSLLETSTQAVLGSVGYLGLLGAASGFKPFANLGANIAKKGFAGRIGEAALKGTALSTLTNTIDLGWKDVLDEEITFKDYARDITEGAMELVSEAMLVSGKITGGFLGGTKQLLTMPVVETVTEQISDMTSDAFTYAYGENEEMQSLIGSLIKEGKITNQARETALSELITGLFLGGGGMAKAFKDEKTVRGIKKEATKIMSKSPEDKIAFIRKLQSNIGIASYNAKEESSKELSNNLDLILSASINDGSSIENEAGTTVSNKVQAALRANKTDIDNKTRKDIAELEKNPDATINELTVQLLHGRNKLDVMNSVIDKEGNAENVKDFFGYTNTDIANISNDVITELTKEFSNDLDALNADLGTATPELQSLMAESLFKDNALTELPKGLEIAERLKDNLKIAVRYSSSKTTPKKSINKPEPIEAQRKRKLKKKVEEVAEEKEKSLEEMTVEELQEAKNINRANIASRKADNNPQSKQLNDRRNSINREIRNRNKTEEDEKSPEIKEEEIVPEIVEEEVVERTEETTNRIAEIEEELDVIDSKKADDNTVDVEELETQRLKLEDELAKLESQDTPEPTVFQDVEGVNVGDNYDAGKMQLVTTIDENDRSGVVVVAILSKGLVYKGEIIKKAEVVVGSSVDSRESKLFLESDKYQRLKKESIEDDSRYSLPEELTQETLTERMDQYEGKTFGELAGDFEYTFDKLDQLVFSKILPLIEKYKVVIDVEMDAAANWSSKEKVFRFNPTKANNATSHSMMLHEAIHAYTTMSLSKKEKTALNDILKELYINQDVKDLIKKYGENEPAYMDFVNALTSQEKQDAIENIYKSLYAKGTKQDISDAMQIYPLINSHELVGGLFSMTMENKLIEILLKKDDSKKGKASKSLFNKIVDIIANLSGFQVDEGSYANRLHDILFSGLVKNTLSKEDLREPTLFDLPVLSRGSKEFALSKNEWFSKKPSGKALEEALTLIRNDGHFTRVHLKNIAVSYYGTKNVKEGKGEDGKWYFAINPNAIKELGNIFIESEISSNWNLFTLNEKVYSNKGNKTKPIGGVDILPANAAIKIDTEAIESAEEVNSKQLGSNEDIEREAIESVIVAQTDTQNDTDVEGIINENQIDTENIDTMTSSNNISKIVATAYHGKLNSDNYEDFVRKNISASEFFKMKDVLKSTDATNEDVIRIQNIMKKEAKKKGVEYNEYVDATFTRIWKKIQNTTEKSHFIVEFDSEGKIKWLRQVKGEYKAVNGKQNTKQIKKQVENYQGALSEIFGFNVDVQYLGGFEKNKYKTESYQQSNIDPSTLITSLYKLRKVFLNVFGERKTLPIIAFEFANTDKFEATIESFYEKYSEGLPKKVVATDIATKASLVTRILLEELRLNNSIENINKGISVLTGKDMIALMKRGTMSTDSPYSDSYIENQIDVDGVIGHYKDDNGNVIVKNIVVAGADTMKQDTNGKLVPYYTDEELETVLDTGEMITNEQGEYVPITITLKDFLQNLIGIDGHDGVSYVLAGNHDSMMQQENGTVKKGVMKTSTTFGGLFIKHSAQRVNPKSIFGKILATNDLGMVSMDSAEKNNKAQRVSVLSLLGVGVDSMAEAIEGSKAEIEQSINHIPLSQFLQIKNTGKVKGEVKGLMQSILSSGFGIGNKYLDQADTQKGRTLGIFKTLTDNNIKLFKQKVESLLGEQELQRFISNIDENAMDAHTFKIAQILRTASEELDVKDLKGLLSNPYFNTLLRDKLNGDILNLFKYKHKGSMPTLRPNQGYGDMSEIRAIESGLWKSLLTNEKVLKDMVADISIKGVPLAKKIRDIYNLEMRRDKLTSEIQNGMDEENEIYLTTAELAELKNERNNIFRTIRKEKRVTAAEHRKQLPNVALGREATLTTYYTNKEAGREFVNKEKYKYFDKETGRLKHGYAIISKDVANKNGLREGDKVITSITPTDSSRGIMNHQVVGILSNADTDIGTIILPSSYIQSVGKDYDVDNISMYVRDERLLENGDWEYLVGKKDEKGIFQKTDEIYIKSTAKKYESIGIVKKQGESDLEFISKQSNMLKFMQITLGTVDGEKGNYSPASVDSLALGKEWFADIGATVGSRTFHILMSNIGFKSKVKTEAGDIVIDPNKQFDLATEVLRIRTNNQVDFPKDDSKLKYNKDENVYSELIYGLYNKKERVDRNVVDAINEINFALFFETQQLPRGVDAQSNKRVLQNISENQNSNGTIDQIQRTREVFGILEEISNSKGKDKEKLASALFTQIFPVLTNPANTKPFVVEYLKNIKIGDLGNYGTTNIAMNIDINSIQESSRTLTYAEYNNVEKQNYYKLMSGGEGFAGLYSLFDRAKKSFPGDFKKLEHLPSGIAPQGEHTTTELLSNLLKAIDLYDEKNGEFWGNTIADKSLRLLREKVKEIIMPSPDYAGQGYYTDDSGKERHKNHADVRARQETFPDMLKMLFENNTFTFNKLKKFNKATGKMESQKYDEAIQRGEGKVIVKGVEIVRTESDGLGIIFEDVNGNERKLYSQNLATDLENFIHVANKLNTEANRIKLFEYLDFKGSNIQMNKKIAYAKETISRLANTKAKREVGLMLSSFMLPYAEGEGGMAITPIDARSIFTSKIYKDNAYIGTGASLELMLEFYPEMLTFSAKNYTDLVKVDLNSNKIENDLLKEPVSFDLPTLNPRSSATKNNIDAVDSILSRDVKYDEMIKNSKEFRKVLKSSPEDAMKLLKAMVQDEEVMEALMSEPGDTMRLENLLDDVQNKSFKEFNRIYSKAADNSTIAQEINQRLLKLDEEQLGNVEGKMMRIFSQLSHNRKVYKNNSKKVNIGLKFWQKLNNMSWYALKNGFNRFVKDQELDFPILNMLKGTVEKDTPNNALKSQSIFNPRLQSSTNLSAVFNSRAENNEDGLAYVRANLEQHLHKSKLAIDEVFTKITNQLKGKGKSVDIEYERIQFNKQVNTLAEEWWKTSAEPNTEFRLVDGIINIYYKGEKVTKDKLLDSLLGDVTSESNEMQLNFRATLSAAVELRMLYDVRVPNEINLILQYLNDTMDSFEKDALETGSQVALKNMRYLTSIIKRYSDLKGAMDSFKEQDISYVPRNYDHQEVLNLYMEKEFKPLYEQLRAEREYSKINGTPSKYSNMSDDQLKRSAKKMIKEEFAYITEDNPSLVFNPNWAQRLTGDAVMYDRETMKPHHRYVENYINAVRTDMIFVDHLIYEQQANKYGEDQTTIDKMNDWFAMQSNNVLLRMNQLEKTKVKKGMEITFSYQEDRVFFSSPTNEFVVKGQIIYEDSDSVTIALNNGKEKTYNKGEYTLETGFENVEVFGKVVSSSKDSIVLEHFDENKTYNTDRTYVLRNGERNYNEVDRFMKKGMLEAIENYGRENGGDASTTLKMMKLTNKGFDLIDTAISISLLGGIRQFVAGARNKVGGLRSIKTLIKGAKMSKAKDLMTFAQKAEELDPNSKEGQKAFALQTAMLSRGLFDRPGMVSEVVASKGSMNESSLELFGSSKDLKVIIRTIMDSSGFSKYENERRQLYVDKLATEVSDPEKSAEIGRQMQKNREEYESGNYRRGSNAMRSLLNVILKDNGSINAELRYTRKQALSALWEYVKGSLSKSSFFWFLQPEQSLRLLSFTAGFQKAQDAGMSLEDSIDAGVRAEKFTQARYEAFARQIGWDTRIGKQMFKFSHYNYNDIQENFKLYREASQQVKEFGLNSLNPFQDLVTEDGKPVKVGVNKENSKINEFMLNAGKPLARTAVYNFLISAGSNAFMPGLGSVTSPVWNAVINIGSLLFKALDDEDYETAEYFQNAFEAVPYLGFLFRALIDSVILDKNLWEENPTVKFTKEFIDLIDGDKKSLNLLKSFGGYITTPSVSG